MPYTLPQDYTRFENVIKAINDHNHAFVINVGDIKSSSTLCTEESYTKMLSYFSQFNKPLIYTQAITNGRTVVKKMQARMIRKRD